MEFSKTRKEQIIAQVGAFVARYDSQNKAATALGISPATLSSIRNGKVENISNEMWAKLESATQALQRSANEWQLAEISSYQEIAYALNDAQQFNAMTWIVGDAGCGKTTSARAYAANHRNAFYILCSEDMKKSDFLKSICKQLGVKVDGLRNSEIPQAIAENVISEKQDALLMFDEADKLQDNVLAYFIQLYNMLEGYCGIVMLSTAYAKKRMQRGLACSKRGYAELDSRMGRRFFELSNTDANDVYVVCACNGITDREAIGKIIEEAKDYDFDLRRVKRCIRREILKGGAR